MTKELYVVVSNGGDGSCYAQYTFNKEWIDKMQYKSDNDGCDENGEYDEYFFEQWSDGDGFHYDTLTVPDECTLQSLGIYSDVAEND